MMEGELKEGFVDAIEEGRIVRVSEQYAKQEGLMILRQPTIIEKKPVLEAPKSEHPRLRGKSPLDLDRYRRPLNYSKNNVIGELANNFHWEIMRVRKARNLTRKAVATALGVQEEHIKMIENGILPSDDYILVSKIEKYFGISLRKDKHNYHEPIIKKSFTSGIFPEKSEGKNENVSSVGNDIEV